MSLQTSVPKHYPIIWLAISLTCFKLALFQFAYNMTDVLMPSNSTMNVQDQAPDSKVHIFITADQKYKLPMYTLINSIITNEQFKHRLNFHILVLENTSLYQTEINHYFRSYISEITFELKSMMDYNECIAFNKTVSMYTIYEYSGQRRTLNKPMLLSRFCLPSIFTNVSVGIFLDSDMIVQESISKLYDEYYNKFDYIAWSVMNKDPKRQFDDLYKNQERAVFFNDYLQHNLSSIFASVHPIDFTKMGPTFNGGILMFSFDIWRKYNFTEQSLELFKFENMYSKTFDTRPWKDRTQPIINLLFHINQMTVGAFDGNWNWVVHHWKSIAESTKEYNEKLKSAKLVHWSGKYKPWKKANVSSAALWIGYIPQNANISDWENNLNVHFS